MCYLNPGSFGSRPPNGVNRCQAVFGKMLEAFDHLVAKPSYQRERGVPECGEDLRCMPGMSTCLVFAAGHIAYVMKVILDPPVRTRQAKQLGRTRLFRGETGYRIDGLNGFLTPHDPFPGDAANLCHTGPERRQKRAQRRGGFDLAGLDPAVAFLDRFGTPEVSRSRPYRRGGKTAGRPVRYPLSGRAGCP